MTKLFPTAAALMLIAANFAQAGPTGTTVGGSIAKENRAAQDTRIKIASWNHREVGCSASSAPFKAAIPNFDRLDKGYQGALAGIEIVVRERNGTASYGDLAFTNDGSVTGSLSARGAGMRIRMPWGGGNVCHRAEGANIAIDIYAHYKEGGA